MGEQICFCTHCVSNFFSIVLLHNEHLQSIKNSCKFRSYSKIMFSQHLCLCEYVSLNREIVSRFLNKQTKQTYPVLATLMHCLLGSHFSTEKVSSIREKKNLILLSFKFSRFLSFSFFIIFPLAYVHCLSFVPLALNNMFWGKNH